jgi:hypothetical protein
LPERPRMSSGLACVQGEGRVIPAAPRRDTMVGGHLADRRLGDGALLAVQA